VSVLKVLPGVAGVLQQVAKSGRSQNLEKLNWIFKNQIFASIKNLKSTLKFYFFEGFYRPLSFQT
jgi:hypothetical protein